jgi:predicted phage terminase large subunit-like protein
MRKRQTVGERAWQAQFQQNPLPPASDVFGTADFQRIEMPMLAPETLVVRAWDVAQTVFTGGNDPDYTVGLKLAYEPEGRLVVLDVVRLRGSVLDVAQLVTRMAQADGFGVRISLPFDPGGAWMKARISDGLMGYNFEFTPERGSKVLRATPVGAQIAAGRVVLVRAGWNGDLVEELRCFPNGRHDDQVDALSRAFDAIVHQREPAQFINSTFSER